VSHTMKPNIKEIDEETCCYICGGPLIGEFENNECIREFPCDNGCNDNEFDALEITRGMLRGESNV